MLLIRLLVCKYVITHYQVVIAVRSHLFPFRTEKLSSLAPMVLQCGRVGSRLLLSRASDFERFLRLFCFPTVLLSYRPAFFPQLLTAPFTFLPFYFFTFIYFSLKNDGESSLVMFMYKMLMNCGFYIYKISKITY